MSAITCFFGAGRSFLDFVSGFLDGGCGLSFPDINGCLLVSASIHNDN